MVDRKQAMEAMNKVISYISRGNLDEHTEGTAERYIKAWENDWGKGYDYKMKFTTFNSDDTDQMVIEMNIPVYSHCAHHLAPIVGVCHIAYLPGEKIVGLSKLNRTVEKFARRLQVQERLTSDIALELDELLKARGVAVQIVAEHMCVSSRGIKHHGAKTITTKLTGYFLDKPAVKAEFLGCVRG